MSIFFILSSSIQSNNQLFLSLLQIVGLLTISFTLSFGIMLIYNTFYCNVSCWYFEKKTKKKKFTKWVGKHLYIFYRGLQILPLVPRWYSLTLIFATESPLKILKDYWKTLVFVTNCCDIMRLDTRISVYLNISVLVAHEPPKTIFCNET